MPTTVFTNPYVVLTTSTQSLHSQLRAVRLVRTFDEHDDTRFGMTDHSRVPGLGSWSLELEAISEYGSTEAVPLDAILAAKVGSAAFEIVVRPLNAARSSDNPEYRGNVRLFEYQPIGGNVGDVLTTPIRLLSAGSLTRVVTSS